MKKRALGLFAIIILLGSCLQKNETGMEFSVEKAADGFMFAEGPVWVKGKGLLFSDIPAGKVYLYTPGKGAAVYLEDSGHSNGLALDKQGALFLAQHGSRQIGRLGENGTIESVASSFEGKRLNSPNDLAVHSSGSIFFTDPPFGLMDTGIKSELGFSGIFRIDPDGGLHLLENGLELPNGIAFNADETLLYADDSRLHVIYSWKVNDDLSLSDKKVFARIPVSGYADGMKTDGAGNLYVTGPAGLWVFSPEGDILKNVSVPGQDSASNCAWGDVDGMSLYVTSNNALYRVRRVR